MQILASVQPEQVSKMHIKSLVVKNYRTLKDVYIVFNEHLNIVVGDNETGKSTVLEAINLALNCRLNGRGVQNELHPFLFNAESVGEYIEKLKNKTPCTPPVILVELYLNDDVALARMKGTNNSRSESCPGISFSLEFDEAYKSEYADYIKNPETMGTLPIEYYAVNWRTFAGNDIPSRGVPVKSTLIDASTIRNYSAANRYVLDIVNDYLTPNQRVGLSLSYRKMKDRFLEDDSVKKINEELLTKKGKVSERVLSVSLDTTSRAGWQSGVMPHLDDIPLPLVGKGEQNNIKIKLAMDASAKSNIFLIEEPENHLSYPNLNKLIGHIASQSTGKQLILTTHSSFVLNKLGVESVLFFTGQQAITLKDIDAATHDYFLKLPGHDTLRLILAREAILVEGPSDELIVQKAFVMKHGCMPLEKGIDVIAVKSLAFKRFLEIAKLLKRKVSVVTDNDGDLAALKTKYVEFDGCDTISIFYDTDITCKTLEPQMLKANSLKTINEVLGKAFTTNDEVLKYMENNKTDVALKIFNTTKDVKFPEYISKAVGA